MEALMKKFILFVSAVWQYRALRYGTLLMIALFALSIVHPLFGSSETRVQESLRRLVLIVLAIPLFAFYVAHPTDELTARSKLPIKICMILGVAFSAAGIVTLASADFSNAFVCALIGLPLLVFARIFWTSAQQQRD
jgi:cell division protein FtsW (lipid II flippase)